MDLHVETVFQIIFDWKGVPYAPYNSSNMLFFPSLNILVVIENNDRLYME